MRINNIPVRYVGQRWGANYAPPFPGEHVKEYLDLRHARQDLTDDPFGCDGDTILLWRCDPNDSPAEAYSRTLSDAAEADVLLTLRSDGFRRPRVTTEYLGARVPSHPKD